LHFYLCHNGIGEPETRTKNGRRGIAPAANLLRHNLPGRELVGLIAVGGRRRSLDGLALWNQGKL
jgi:hypothetical protein